MARISIQDTLEEVWGSQGLFVSTCESRYPVLVLDITLLCMGLRQVS